MDKRSPEQVKGAIDWATSDPFWSAKLVTARFFADHFLTQAPGLAESVVSGAAGALEMAADSF